MKEGREGGEGGEDRTQPVKQSFISGGAFKIRVLVNVGGIWERDFPIPMGHPSFGSFKCYVCV